MSAHYTVIAEFRTTPENHDAFALICHYDAERSVTDEAGCQAFHVLEPVDQPNTIVLYEVYDDEAAFNTHNHTPHFAKFAHALDELGIETHSVRFLRRAAG